MTREEAIEIIEDLIADVIRTTAEENKALDLAISALQAELSVSIQPKAIANNCDLISRADAINAFERGEEYHSDTIADILSDIPSADRPTMIPIELKKRYPNSKDEDITDAFMRGYQHGRTECDRPSGEWIPKQMQHKATREVYEMAECSVCGASYVRYENDDYSFDLNKPNYCPNCGAKMK